MGIEGETPDLVETRTIKSRVEGIHTNKSIRLNGTHRITFDPEKHLIFNYFKTLPQHPNGLRFCAYDANANLIATNEYFSIGGGFVVNEDTQLDHGENVYYKQEEKKNVVAERLQQDIAVVSLPFRNAEDLINVCKRENMTIAQVVYENELKWHSASEIKGKLLRIWNTMDESIRNGVMASSDGNFFLLLSFSECTAEICCVFAERLPGELKVRRRAPALYQKLLKGLYSPLSPMRTEYNGTQLSASAIPDEEEPAPGKSSFPLALSVLPRRQRKRFVLPGKGHLAAG